MNKKQIITQLKEENKRIVPNEIKTITEQLIFATPDCESVAVAMPAPKRFNKLSAFIASAICLILVLCLSITLPLTLQNDGNLGYSLITLDVNPAFEIKISEGKVQNIKALDKEAAAISATLPSMVGMQQKDALIMLVQAINSAGYFETNKQINIFVGGDSEKKLNTVITNEINSFLTANLPDVNLNNTYDTKKVKEAKKLKVSLSKYLLMERAAAVSGKSLTELSEEDLEDLIEMIYEYDSSIVEFGNAYKREYDILLNQYNAKKDLLEKEFESMKQKVEFLLDIYDEQPNIAPSDLISIFGIDNFEIINRLYINGYNFSDALEKFLEEKEELLETALDDLEEQLEKRIEELKNSL